MLFLKYHNKMKFILTLTLTLLFTSCSHNNTKNERIQKFEKYVYPYIKEIVKDDDIDSNIRNFIKENWLEINYDYINDESYPTIQCINASSISNRIIIINIIKFENVRESFVLSDTLKEENKFGFKKFHNKDEFYRYLLIKKSIINCLN